MKNFIKYSIVFIAFAVIFSSCKKDKIEGDGNTTITVNLKHDYATNVFLFYQEDGEAKEVEMSKVLEN